MLTSMFAMAQTPFVCEGQGFITFKESATSTILGEINVDYSTNTVSIDQLGTVSGSINSIGYRTTDNFIYGVHVTSHDLYRISAEPQSSVIANLPLTSSLHYPAGDVTPDGKYLILIGNTAPSSSTIDMEMVFVDLTDPNYAIDKVIDISGHNTRIVDIAFHPVTGDIYAFDLRGSKLVVLDPNDGSIKKAYPETSTRYQIGAIYFDQFGQLRGYGKKESGPSQRELYEIDLVTGELNLVSSSVSTTNSDACSCPFTIDLLKTVEKSPVQSCTEVDYYFAVLNLTSNTQTGVSISDQFPTGFNIVAINNPFGGTVVSGVGSNQLNIENMTIPYGVDTIIVTVYLDQVEGLFMNQAMLSDLPVSFGSSKLSDYPLTKVLRDSTPLEVKKEIQSSTYYFDTTICVGESIVFTASGTEVLWQDSSTEQSITVQDAGQYTVVYSTDCGDTITEVFTLSLSEVEVDIEYDLYEFEFGVPLPINAIEVKNLGDSSHYEWSGLSTNFSCIECKTTTIESTTGEVISVILTNEHGCTDTAFAELVLLDFNPFYIPNAFSPNNDSKNDVFYVYGTGYKIIYLEIYDQWGGLQYRFTPGSFTGIPENSWDGGEFHPEELFSNVFIYVGELEDVYGKRYTVSGTITLMR